MLEVFGKIRQIEIVFIHAIYRGQAAGYRALPKSKLGDIHCHLANGNCAGNRCETYPAIGEIKRATRDNAQSIAPHTATQYQASVFFINR